MADPLRSVRSFLSELKQRKVVGVALAYIVVAAGALELVSIVVPSSSLPDWSDELFLALAIFGFPVVVFLAWAFERTPDGVHRAAGATANIEETAGPISGATAIDVVEPGPPGAAPSVAESGPGPPGAAPSVAESGPGPSLDVNLVAVLPFENLSGTDEAEPFAAGLHDDLLTELSRVSALTVISRTSVSGFRGSGKTIPQIARELRAGTVVEGGVQKAGSRVRLNVQLIDARDDVHLWAERYDRELTAENIFELQSELATRIAATLEAHLTPEETARLGQRPTDDLEAYRLYTQGRGVLGQLSGSGMQRAIDYFQRALERDPDYSLAWAGLGIALVQLGEYGHADHDTMLGRGEKAARRALELDSELAEAHAAIGTLHSARCEGPAALRSLRRATELQPSYSQAHHWLSWVYLLVGRPQLALEAGKRSTRLDPLEPEGRANFALAYLGCGQPEKALAEARRALETHPDFDYARWVIGLALRRIGRGDEAEEILRQVSESWASSWPGTMRALNLVTAGDEASARRFVEAREGTGESYYAGVVLAALGALDEAFDGLRQASPTNWSETLFVRYELPELLDPDRDDPRYAELLRDIDRIWGVEQGSTDGMP